MCLPLMLGDSFNFNEIDLGSKSLFLIGYYRGVTTHNTL